MSSPKHLITTKSCNVCYVNKFSLLQKLSNILTIQISPFGIAEKGYFWHLERIDYQYSYYSQFVSSSTGKEKDSETGFCYFGARYYDCDLSGIFLSVDPMSDKYPSISPYAYCAWNPMKLVDPDGREVYIYGDQSDKAVECLQTKKMEIKRDSETGKLSVSFKKGYTMDDLSDDEKIIYEAICDENVSIQVRAETSMVLDGVNAYRGNDGNLYQTYGGSFDGSVFLNDNGHMCAITYDYLDVDLLEKNGFNQGVPHEISEQYLMGLKTIELRKSIPCARNDQPNPEYDVCHDKAIFQESIGLHIGKLCIPPSKFGRK